MKKTLIITVLAVIIGLVWWGCENQMNPVEPIKSSTMERLTISFNGVPSNGCCLPPPADMVGWWTGDGNADDSEGSNRDMETDTRQPSSPSCATAHAHRGKHSGLQHAGTSSP